MNSKERVLASDGKMYYNLAVNLLEYNIFSNPIGPPFVPNTFRTPIYPLFLAFWYALFGYKLYVPIICQIFISSLTCIITYKLGKMLLIEKAAFCAGLLTAFEYSGVVFSNILITDTLFSFLQRSAPEAPSARRRTAPPHHSWDTEPQIRPRTRAERNPSVGMTSAGWAALSSRPGTLPLP